MYSGQNDFKFKKYFIKINFYQQVLFTMEKNLYIDASHPEETRIVLNQILKNTNLRTQTA